MMEAQTSASDAVGQVIRREEERYRAILRADTATLDDLFSGALAYTHSTGVVDTKASYLDAIRTGRLLYRAVEVSEQRTIEASGGGGRPLVVVLCRTRMDVVVDGSPRQLDNRTTGIWVWDGNAYRLLAFHSTPLR
jgi:hypothetical protein